MLWKIAKRENICDDNIFLTICGKGLGMLSIAYVKQLKCPPQATQIPIFIDAKNVRLKPIAKKISINTY